MSGFAFEGGGRPGPEVARRDRSPALERSQLHSLRSVLGGDRGALGALGEMVFEPRRLVRVERPVQALSGARASARVWAAPIVLAAAPSADHRQRSSPDVAARPPLLSAVRSAARAWRRLSRARVRSARAAT